MPVPSTVHLTVGADVVFGLRPPKRLFVKPPHERITVLEGERNPGMESWLQGAACLRTGYINSSCLYGNWLGKIMHMPVIKNET